MGMTTPRGGTGQLQDRSTRARGRDGFTIVSMIVAIVLLTVGILALGNANTTTIKSQVLAQNRTNAVAIGRAYLEEVRVRDPWTLTSESPINVGADGVEESGGPYRRSMVVTEERQNLLLVELFVDFPRSEQPVRLTTYQYRGSGISSAP
jgi:type II secretory pathway pseudopilin PulG